MPLYLQKQSKKNQNNGHKIYCWFIAAKFIMKDFLNTLPIYLRKQSKKNVFFIIKDTVKITRSLTLMQASILFFFK